MADGAAVADSIEKMVADVTKYMPGYRFKQKLQLSAAELNKHFARPFGRQPQVGCKLRNGGHDLFGQTAWMLVDFHPSFQAFR
jgi:acetaldehyde dehydrogenase (acetylating)